MPRKRYVSALAVLATTVMLMSCSKSVDDEGAATTADTKEPTEQTLSLIHISEPTRPY